MDDVDLNKVLTLIEQISKERAERLRTLRRDFPSKGVEINRLEGNIGAFDQVVRWLTGVE